MFNKLLYATIASRGTKVVRRLSHRLSSKPLTAPVLQIRSCIVRPPYGPSLRKEFPLTKSTFSAYFITNTRGFRSHSSAHTREGWLAWLGKNKKKTIGVAIVCMLAYFYFTSEKLPRVVKAGAQVLHQPSPEVYPGEIGSARVEKVIDDLVKVIRKHKLVSLSAPQIGVPLRIIVLDDRKLYTALSPNKVNEEQATHPFDLVVILNPKLKEKSNKTALFFESCASVSGYAAIVERFLEVEVTGLDQDGEPIKVDASGWQARILQHECDHLDGILYVDKMKKGTFGTVLNHKLRLAKGLPQQRVR